MIVITIKCYITHPNKEFWHIISVLFISLMCHTPFVIKATRAQFNNLTMKYTPIIRGRCVQLILSERVLARWHVHGIVPVHRHGHWNVQQSGHILHRRFVCCRPGGCRGDTEQVVAQWWRLVALMKTLDLLHWRMRAVLHRYTAMAIKKACDGGAFVCCRRLFCLA